jgi:tyrosyl-tRNA synthetase
LVVTCSGISSSEARRLISQGGVKIDGDKLGDPAQEVDLTQEEQVLQVGKRKFFKIRYEK